MLHLLLKNGELRTYEGDGVLKRVPGQCIADCCDTGCDCNGKPGCIHTFHEGHGQCVLVPVEDENGALIDYQCVDWVQYVRSVDCPCRTAAECSCESASRLQAFKVMQEAPPAKQADLKKALLARQKAARANRQAERARAAEQEARRAIEQGEAG